MIKSQFAYCPLVWMFCFRQSNNLINKVHERALKLIYQDNSNFEVLLEKQHDFSIHQRNLQVLMTEIYKIVNGIAPPIMNSLFTFRLNQHNLRNFQELSTEKKILLIMVSKQLHTGRLLLGQNYHQNINLQVR